MKTLLFNNLRLFFKDKKAVVLTFLLPVGLTSLFMFVFGGNTKQDKRGMSEMDLGICDLVQNNKSQQLVTDLDSNKSFLVELIDDSAKVRDQVRKGNLNAGIIVLQKNNDLNFIVILDGAREIENAMLKPMLNMELMGKGNGGMKSLILSKIKQEFPDIEEKDLTEIDDKFTTFKSEEFENMSSESMRTEVIKPDSGVHPGAIQAISGTALMTLLFAVAGMGAGIIEEKEKGTLRRILISPVKPMDFMMAKFFTAVIIGFLQLMLTLIFSMVVFNFPVFSRPLEIMLLIFVTAMACSSFGMLLAGIAESRKQIESLSTIVVLLMSLLGGSMIPAFIMPPLMQKFSMITINYWAGEGFFDLYYRNMDTGYFMVKIAVLLIFSLVLIMLSAYLFKRKLARLF